MVPSGKRSHFAMEKHHAINWKTHYIFLWQFSIANCNKLLEGAWLWSIMIITFIIMKCQRKHLKHITNNQYSAYCGWLQNHQLMRNITTQIQKTAVFSVSQFFFKWPQGTSAQYIQIPSKSEPSADWKGDTVAFSPIFHFMGQSGVFMMSSCHSHMALNQTPMEVWLFVPSGQGILPSFNLLQFAIENGHRNSEFSQ